VKLFRLDRSSFAQQEEPNGSACRATRRYRLDSVLRDAHFDAEIQAEWLPMERGYDTIVFRFVGGHANAVTKRFSVLNADAANDELNEFLAAMQLPGELGIRLLSARVTLRVAVEDHDFALRQASIARQAQADAAELAAKHAHLMRLRELFLRDSAMAMLWWFDGDRDRMLSLTEKGDRFDTIVGLITNSPNVAPQSDKIAPLVADFLADLGVDHRTYLIGQLAKIFESYHRSDLAEALHKSESFDMSQGETYVGGDDPGIA
jgi:hypothetical protein